MTREEALEEIEIDSYFTERYGETVISTKNAISLVERIFEHFKINQKALIVQSAEVKEIVEHLNQVCKTNYKHSSAKTKTLVNARLRDGFTLEDFKKVHITKYAEWYGTDMQKYLRPETLYGTKFESYLNQVPTDYDKLNAITSHTGLTPLQFLKQQGFAE